MEYRKCGAEDLSALRRISCETFTAAFAHLNTPEDMAAHVNGAFAEEKLKRELECPDSSFWFLTADGQLAGYMKLNESAAQTDIHDPMSLEIERIYVSGDYQSRGWGGGQIEKAVGLARDAGKKYVWLGVWEHNARAISFYKRHGFEPFGTHPFYLGNDAQTDILMKRDLSL